MHFYSEQRLILLLLVGETGEIIPATSKSCNINMSVSVFQDAVPAKDGVARHPGVCTVGDSPPSFVAHSGIHHSGRVATTGTNGWEASGREAPRTRSPIGQHLLSCEGQCGKVWALFNQLIYYISAQQSSTKSWFPPMHMSPACWRVMDVYVRVRVEE